MLSDTKIKSLKPLDKMCRVLDAERLYIEVRPSGKKICRFKYTLNGKEGAVNFGEYPTVSLTKDGVNPVDDKKQKK